MIPYKHPFVLVIRGVNGAGKTTSAKRLLQGSLNLPNFLNADLIAQGLSPFDPTLADLADGEILLKRMTEFGDLRESFGLESTLSGRSLASRLMISKNRATRSTFFTCISTPVTWRLPG
jgi:predicted ABC-type ATPase